MPTPLRNPVAQTFSLLFRRLSVGKPWRTEVLSSLDPAQSQSPGRSEDLRYSRQESLRFVPAVWLALFVAFSVAGSALAGNVKTGDAFPDLAGFKLEGKLPDSTKGKVVLVDFWASWCEPCKQSFPVMEELHKRYAERGLVIVAVNVDENRADMEAFLKKNAASFTVMRDAGQKLVEKTGIATMPSSFLLDRDGKVRFAHTGFRGAETKKKYEEEIESLLK